VALICSIEPVCGDLILVVGFLPWALLARDADLELPCARGSHQRGSQAVGGGVPEQGAQQRPIFLELRQRWEHAPRDGRSWRHLKRVWRSFWKVGAVSVWLGKAYSGAATAVVKARV
jgi:hypothetical protein